MLSTYLAALLLTVALETPVVAAVFAGQRLRMAAVCALATTVTHLVMHFGVPRVVGSVDQFMIVGEIGALVTEAVVYALLSRPRDVGRALVASALANGLSYGVGLVVFRA